MELPEQKEMERGLSHFCLIHAKNFTEIAMKIQEKQNPQQNCTTYFITLGSARIEKSAGICEVFNNEPTLRYLLQNKTF